MSSSRVHWSIRIHYQSTVCKEGMGEFVQTMSVMVVSPENCQTWNSKHGTRIHHFNHGIRKIFELDGSANNSECVS